MRFRSRRPLRFPVLNLIWLFLFALYLSQALLLRVGLVALAAVDFPLLTVERTGAEAEVPTEPSP